MAYALSPKPITATFLGQAYELQRINEVFQQSPYSLFTSIHEVLLPNGEVPHESPTSPDMNALSLHDIVAISAGREQNNLLSLVTRIRTALPKIGIVGINIGPLAEGVSPARALFASGANTYADLATVPASEHAQVLFLAFQSAYSGGFYTNAQLSLPVLSISTNVVNELLKPAKLLSPREAQVACLSLYGLTIAKIAERLKLEPKTVERHINNILPKFKLNAEGNDGLVTSRLSLLARVLINSGVIPPNPPDFSKGN